MSNSLPKRQPGFVVLATIFVIVSCLLGNVIAVMASKGIFESWHPLDNPLISATKIINADYETIWVQLKNGIIMTRRLDCYYNESQDMSCSEWVEAENVPDHPTYQMYPLERNTSCKFGPSPNPPVTPSPAIECVSAVFVGPEYMNTRIYAILENGSVWYWSLHGDSLGPFPSILICANFLSPLMGLIIAVIYYAVSNSLRKKVENIGIINLSGQGK